MGTGESGTPSKSAKAAPSQEHSNTPALYVDWATAIQAYHTAVTNPPPGYFPSSASSGLETHSYLWGGQPLMPPYGTPPPYAVYPPGGMFTHPSMPPGSIIYGQYEVTPTGSATETSTVIPIGLGEGKMIESKEKLPILQNRSFEHVSAEGMQAQSSNIPVFHSQLEALGATSDGEVLGTSASQMVNASHTICSGKPATEILPITNINIGIDYWNGLTPSTITVAKGRLYSSVSAAMAPANGSSVVLGPACDGIPPGLWLQDEREMKRQRRKQSNRESARRSRLRKQAECEELAVKVDSLSAENSSLRVELNRLIELSKKLASENSSLHEQIRKAQQGSRNWHDHKNKLHSERNGIPGRDIQAGNSDSSEKIDKDHVGEKALSSLDVNYAEVVTAS